MLSLSFLMFLFHHEFHQPRPMCIRMMKESNTHPQVDGRRGRMDNESAAMSKTLCQQILTVLGRSLRDVHIR